MTPRSLNWLKATIIHPPAAAEAVSALLFEEGAQGVWEDQPDRRGRQVTRSGFPPDREAGLAAALPLLVARLAEAFAFDPAEFDFSLEIEENHDWAEKWKEGLKPVLIGPGLALAPTWWPEDDLPHAEVVLRLDPGLAFGSGHHASTFMCLMLLADQAPAAQRVLDVGAGSGILSLAAAALNPKARVVGVDNDPETIAVARENAEINHLERQLDFSNRGLDQLDGPFDLIAANITLGPLTEIAPYLKPLAAPGARLILSGLLESQLAEAMAAYEQWGWSAIRCLIKDEWAALLLTLDPAPGPLERVRL